MDSPRVWNKRDRHTPDGAVYIGRPSKWGNPFSHLSGTLAKYRVETREEGMAQYRTWLENVIRRDPDALNRIRAELGGKHLVCWCKPAACHGDVLLELANPQRPTAAHGETS